MTDTVSMTPAHGQPVILTLPAEIDMANVDAIGAQLAAALTPGTRVVIADMTATTFCDSIGIAMLIRARKQATANGTELRLLLPSPDVLRVMRLQGVDAVLPIYHSLEQALAAPWVTIGGTRVQAPRTGSATTGDEGRRRPGSSPPPVGAGDRPTGSELGEVRIIPA